jgi:hypothetical protein
MTYMEDALQHSALVVPACIGANLLRLSASIHRISVVPSVRSKWLASHSCAVVSVLA